jgi:hypothetical protein
VAVTILAALALKVHWTKVAVQVGFERSPCHYSCS